MNVNFTKSLSHSLQHSSFAILQFLGTVMAGLVQLQFFPIFVFETMDEGVNIHLTKAFLKLVYSDLLGPEKFFCSKSRGGVKIMLNFKDINLENNWG